MPSSQQPTTKAGQRRRRRLRLQLKPEENDGIAAKSRSVPRRQSSKRRKKATQQQQQSTAWSREMDSKMSHLETTLTYPGWEDDVAELRSFCSGAHISINDPQEQDDWVVKDWMLESRINALQLKQQAHQGNRSHFHLKTLDQLLPHLTYPAWPHDYQLALQAHFQDNNDWLRARSIWKLQQHQCLHQGDRSHPRIVELDTLKLSYPGWERDFQQVQDFHCSYTDDYMGNQIFHHQLQSLRHRQAHWDGTKSGNLNKINQAASSLNYKGWQDDVEAARQAHLYACGIHEGTGQVVDFSTALQQLHQKQVVLGQGDRSHPRLQQLDAILAQAPPSLQQHPTHHWLALQQQCEAIHFRYASDDLVGNAMMEQLLAALQQYQKRFQRREEKQKQQRKTQQEAISKHSTTITPSKESATTDDNVDASTSPVPSSDATTTTSANTSFEWSDDEEENDDDEEVDDEINQINSNPDLEVLHYNYNSIRQPKDFYQNHNMDKNPNNQQHDLKISVDKLETHLKMLTTQDESDGSKALEFSNNVIRNGS